MDTTLITSLIRGVGRCGCGMSNDVAREAAKDHLLGYVSPSNHMYRPHVTDEVDKTSNLLRPFYP